KEAAALFGIGLSTFWTWAQVGIVPKGKKISSRVTVWSRAELEAVFNAAQAAQNQQPVSPMRNKE
ncbi:MAG: hypothetical protein LBP22_15225, partial [Deltaproteobacteria bacterium]|nr:hypothetical protein [Deltaproteobacteria bacterium]